MATEIKSTSIKSQNIIAEPQVNKPGSPEQGQIIQATGTGDIAKGIYQYSGASWVSLDNAQGDLETLRLVMSTDTDAVGFSSALNSTSTLAGNTNAVPHETSTGTGLLGALEIPSTGGDALLTEFDANKVFRYYSAGANNNNDYFGIPVDIPAQTRGQNIVVKFKYRTEEAGTATTSNGDFQVSVWDKSNGVKTTSTDTSTVAAGSSITVVTSTDMAAGDKIWLESGAQSTIGNVAATFTEAYITEVVDSTHIKISADYTPATTAGSVVVSGWLSSKVEGLLPEADSDTNKVGKDFSIAVKTEETTDQIVVWFSNKSTTAAVIELFFDGILVSQNKFLQASSQLQSESYVAAIQGSFWGSSTAAQTFNRDLLSAGLNTPPIASSKFLDVQDITGPGTAGTVTAIKAKVPLVLDFSVIWYHGNSGTLAALNQAQATIIQMSAPNSSAAGYMPVSSSVSLAKGDYVYFVTTNGGDSAGGLNIVATPTQSDVILLESQDEIFTDWTAFTPTGTWTTNATYEGYWRRNGPNMEIWGQVTTSGAPNTSTLAVDLPSGYAIAEGVGKLFTANVYGDNNFTYGQVWCQDGGGGNVDYVGAVGYNSSTSLELAVLYQDSTYIKFDPVSQVSPFTWAADDSVVFRATVPIQGWNTNFNPLLSMPLVDIGNNTEQYQLAGWSGIYDAGWFYSTETPGINTIDKLGTVTNSSTTGWYFTASQRVKVNVSMSGQSTVGSTEPTILMGDPGDIPSTSNPTTLSAYILNCAQTLDTTTPITVSASCVMEPGQRLVMAQSRSTGGVSTDRYRGGVSLLVERDFSNTNMAHIIKPAVCMIKSTFALGTNGGAGTNDAYVKRQMNTFEGESWFVTPYSGTLGPGGTNTDFSLEAGTYEISFQAVFYDVDYCKSGLYNETNSEFVKQSNVGLSDTVDGTTATTFGEAVITITATTRYSFKSIITNGSGAEDFGIGRSLNNFSGVETYATILVRKLK